MEPVMIRLDDINPFDGAHVPTKKEWVEEVEPQFQDERYSYKSHHDGIKAIKKGLKAGGEITPIAVRETVVDYRGFGRPFERLDGFKRYMAYLELGEEEIPCFILEGADATPGAQFDQPLWIKEPR